ncbi:MAG: hypothetical protein JSV91_02195 [Phycisphaerales bacterium]|nr:MAG: hypothetical protein JSV91_02195 [Phycisphaerales bacterium]
MTPAFCQKLVCRTVPLLPLIIAGCAAAPGSGPPPRPVSLAEFADGEAEVGPGAARQQVPVELSAGPLTAGDGGSGVPPVALRPAPPARSLQPGEQVIVERMVGQVNGRPIFAEEFFEPIANRLIAEAEGKTLQEYGAVANAIIGVHLQEVVMSDLFLAEAEAGLTPEEQRGLIAWLNREREAIISGKGGGSEGETRNRLRETEQISLEEYLEARRDQALIWQLLQDKVKSRVIVSWRDVQREYDRRNREDNRYTPPATLTLARIILPTESRADAIEDVTRRLAEGESFTVVADSVGMRDGGQWGDFELADLSEAIRLRVEGLSAGETAGPFEQGSTTQWLHVAKIDQPPARTVYDPEVQRELIEYIGSRREQEERARYIRSLFEGGIYDELNEMNIRLLEMAILRYGP